MVSTEPFACISELSELATMGVLEGRAGGKAWRKKREQPVTPSENSPKQTAPRSEVFEPPSALFLT